MLFTSILLGLTLANAHPLQAQGAVPTPSALHEQRVASRLGIALLGVALGPQGNMVYSLPCPFRGVIHYVHSEAGLLTRFAGCDLGAGVEVEGQGRLWWPDPGPQAGAEDRFCGFMVGPGLPTCPSTLRWAGTLDVRIDGTSIAPLTEVRIDDLAITDRGAGFPKDLDFRSGVMGFGSMSVSIWGSAFSVADPSLPEQVFAPSGMTLESIPNPEGTLEELTEADIARLAWDGFDLLARWLLNETLETQRGPHTHDLECGTVEITVEDNLPIFHADWPSCEFRGLVWSGSFRMRWSEFGEYVYDFYLEGDLEIGGAVPRTVIEGVRWRSEHDFGSRHLTGAIEGVGQRRPFEYTLGVEE